MATASALREQLASEQRSPAIGVLSPDEWYSPVVNTECSLHQLSPYIGKLKSSIAADVIQAFSRPGDLVIDPFCGAGTVPLEAALLGRKTFSSDVSPYARTLTHGKLHAPATLDLAVSQVEELLLQAEARSAPDLRSVPSWVRAYFHPQTLKEAISFSRVCVEQEHTFALSCFLGILHHQRPGFLSYPSSHLVPYLRTKMFPPDAHPSLYEHRPLRPRLLKKVVRAYKRGIVGKGSQHRVAEGSLQTVSLPVRFDAVITSPPYMNALDYGRDNRLRLWFLEPEAADRIDEETPGNISSFKCLMDCLVAKVSDSLSQYGHCVLIVGEATTKAAVSRTANAVKASFLDSRYDFRLVIDVPDLIPDVRRARRDCRGVKLENVIAFQKLS